MFGENKIPSGVEVPGVVIQIMTEVETSQSSYQRKMHLDVLLKWLSGKDSTCQSACLARSCRFDLCVWKIPWRKKWQPTPVFLLGNSMDRGAWWASVHVVMTEHSCTHWDIVRQPLRLLPQNPHLLLFVPRVTLPLEHRLDLVIYFQQIK